MNEQVQVSVDRNFARFGPKSYAINKINSVEVRTRSPHSKGLPFFFGFVAVILLLAGVEGARVDAMFWGLVFGGAAYWTWQRSKIVEYQLFLMTSSSEAQAITSRDGDFVIGLRGRIEQAIARQLD